MKRFCAPVALAFLLALSPARAADDAPADAPAATPAPAALNWRVAPADATLGTGASLSGLAGAPSRGLLRDFKMILEGQPESKARTELAAAVDDMIKGADAVKPAERQIWIDNHLGELNNTVRHLPQDAPKAFAAQAAAQAAALNNRAERWADGRELAGIALTYDPADKDALISRSQASSALSDFARGYADADAVLRRLPSEGPAWTARAAASYGLGNYLQAVEDARRALAIDPNDKTAFALMKLSEGRTAAAPKFENTSLAQSVEREYHGMVQQLNQVEALRQAPPELPAEKSVRRFIETAGSKLAVKDYHGAIGEADKALEVEPDNSDALFYRAAAENLLGRYGDADRDASRGLSISPSAAFLRDARAWAYIRMGRFTDAISDANHSLEIDPKNPYAYANRGHAHEGRGDYEAMAADLKTAAVLNGQFEPDYRDSTRRHGLIPAQLTRDGERRPFLDAALPPRARSFGIVLLFTVAGGLLIGFGLMHVSNGLRGDREKKARAPSGIELHYELGKAIGHGGMGIVYEARDKRLKRQVAIKMLRDEFLLDAEAKKALIEEAAMVAELQHPSIVDIHGVEQDERGLYLVFERLEGCTLDEVITERKVLPLREIKRVLGPVCSALTYAHGRGVVHRDLKPGNVMLTKDGGVKVLDFGISRHAALSGKAATTQSVVGTPHYMAPEQEYGVIRRENDVFALGAVLYEMVTGSRPFDGTTPAKLAKSYLRPSTRVPGLSPELDALIDRTLEPDPDKRLATPAEFWTALEAINDRRSPA
ncbi:MAG: protein kinase [Elusimicrobia bacterium]|nr:protein kinase [Elusimicrobiota bacterium]